MKVELKNVKHFEAMSEETNCFEATVYLDGVRAGTVSNQGHGGSNRYDPTSLETRLSDYAKTLPPIPFNDGIPVVDVKGVEHKDYQPGPDDVIDPLLTDFLTRRDMKRAMGRKYLFTMADGKLYEIAPKKGFKVADGLATPDKVARLKAALKAEQLLNVLPEDEALRLYMAGSAAPR